MILDHAIARATFGADFSLLKNEPSFAWRQLQSEDWRKRYLAICTLVDVWSLSGDDILSIAKSLVSSDPHEGVVRGALEAVGATFNGSFDEAASQFLAHVIQSEEHATQVRGEAYLALEKTHSHSSEFLGSVELEQAAEKIRNAYDEITSDSFDRINWEWVRQFEMPNGS